MLYECGLFIPRINPEGIGSFSPMLERLWEW
jgi:hypothetical protein